MTSSSIPSPWRAGSGLFVTAMNLFPIGQLDGGHVVLCLFRTQGQDLSAGSFLSCSVILGIFFWVGWIVWALLILLLGVKHPHIWDEEAPLGRTRTDHRPSGHRHVRPVLYSRPRFKGIISSSLEEFSGAE